jgi:hypothetical protein
MTTAQYPTIRWQEAGVEHFARWRSEAGVAAPEAVVVSAPCMESPSTEKKKVETGLRTRYSLISSRLSS